MSKNKKYTSSRALRAFDIASSTCILTAGTPIAAVAAAWLCLETGTLNPFFKQRRVAPHESLEFLMTIWKLKTMELREGEDPDNPFTSGSIDERASRFANKLRVWGVDELPQVVQVLLGQLSMVGIRPQTKRTHEDRAATLPAEYGLWLPAYCQRLGLLGEGQDVAHELGQYKETDPVAIGPIMSADIRMQNEASLENDLKILAKLPLSAFGVELTTSSSN